MPGLHEVLGCLDTPFRPWLISRERQRIKQRVTVQNSKCSDFNPAVWRKSVWPRRGGETKGDIWAGSGHHVGDGQTKLQVWGWGGGFQAEKWVVQRHRVESEWQQLERSKGAPGCIWIGGWIERQVYSWFHLVFFQFLNRLYFLFYFVFLLKYS